jgi:NodT family efflux transporter outer membrane factor (OMF) lipoprotein
MVTLIGDVAAAYGQYRIFEQQIVYARQNVAIQRASLKIATDRWKAGQASEVGVVQATSLLEQLEATVSELDAGLRQANNQLCVLLGMPPADLAYKLGEAPIPESPPELLVGIQADLIRRRPHLRSADRLVAAQNAQVGVAEANFYPAFFITGTLGYEAKDLSQLFTSKSFTGAVGPGFQWNILNYGRIPNYGRFQNFKTQELTATYQQKVLAAAKEVEDAIHTFVDFRLEAQSLAASVQAAERAVKLTTDQYKAGVTDYTPVFVAEQFLAQQQNFYAGAVGDIALSVIGVYRALGGGWELRLAEEAAQPEAASCSDKRAVLGRPRALPEH